MSLLPEDQITIRNVEDADIASIQEIYADEVLHGVSSWEEIPPDQAEMLNRKNGVVGGGYPYRVAVQDDRVVGYAYASSYRPRPGYRFTVENSIYIHKDARGSGLGRLLLKDLINQCEIRGYRQMIAVIGDSENLPSIAFHQKMGFELAGTIKSIGFKFGRWMDSVLMQRPLNDGSNSLPE
ncbi:GCN5 family acetyltransferase [Kiloniella litopenaei]|uniref:GCN5 family acetyltransferase n=1 Tax=Kiloniella litopenaei TaxID=1549748 RepID=A0A0M2RDH4_9PROT|nr:GNAT family N-acetyltransferase [Kiloniella litopenaei]KKJ78509.1 GCN5 family acetyltransferase [Kiloniella litopenaei]